MSPELKQRIQIALGAAILVAGLRTAYILYERHQANQPVSKQELPLNADYYVVPKKLHPYDLQSAKDVDEAAGLGEGRLSLHLLSL